MPHRPVKGLARLARAMSAFCPTAPVEVRLPDGFVMELNCQHATERQLFFSGVYQSSLAQVLRTIVPAGGYVIDIGANLGYYSLLMSKLVGKSGRVAAFEANPYLLARLEADRQRNNFDQLTYYGKAVAERAAEMTFAIARDYGKSSLQADYIKDVQEHISVQTITLDDFIAEQRWPRLDVVKSDIEGSDCQALLGAREAIRRFRPHIVFELWRDTSPEWQEEARKLLQDHCYELQVLHLSGKREPFNWQPFTNHHLDVLCFPR
ncbi:MAG: FkbM family methyltransferase [Anaerolineae bacterium]